MLDIFRDEEAENRFHDAIHQKFGAKSGLLKHEYKLIFDQRGDKQVEIKAGAVIIISTKYTPLEPEFIRVVKHIFDDIPLRDFLRGKNIPRTGGAQWYELGFDNILTPPDKKASVQSYNQKYVTSLEMTDKKTKRSVMVKIEGSAFDAHNEALRLLYGERLS